jgi:hypothetical protein
MAPTAAATALEPAAVQRTIAIDAIVSTERRASDSRALGICRARATESDIPAAPAGAKRATDALVTIKSTATLRTGRAAAAFISAAIQRTIAGNPVVVTEHGAAGLTAFARCGALPTQADGPAVAASSAADAIDTEQTTAANDVPIAPAAIIVAAVQSAVGVDPIGCANRGPCRLAALPGLRA